MIKKHGAKSYNMNFASSARYLFLPFPANGNEVPPKHQNWDIEYFHVATDQLKDAWRQVTKAHVWVHLPGAPGPEDEHAWIYLYYVSVDKNDHAFLTQEKATKVKLRPDRGGWVELNVWDVVSLWFKNPDMNLGINLEASTSTGKTLEIGVRAQPNLVSAFSRNL